MTSWPATCSGILDAARYSTSRRPSCISISTTANVIPASAAANRRFSKVSCSHASGTPRIGSLLAIPAYGFITTETCAWISRSARAASRSRTFTCTTRAST